MLGDIEEDWKRAEKANPREYDWDWGCDDCDSLIVLDSLRDCDSAGPVGGATGVAYVNCGRCRSGGGCSAIR